jgi:hypothetical protein
MLRREAGQGNLSRPFSFLAQKYEDPMSGFSGKRTSGILPDPREFLPPGSRAAKVIETLDAAGVSNFRKTPEDRQLFHQSYTVARLTERAQTVMYLQIDQITQRR